MITTNERLRILCIIHDWFTCGDKKQYEKLFYANEHGYTVEEIATIIWLCTDEKWKHEEIHKILTEERKIFKNRLKKGNHN